VIILGSQALELFKRVRVRVSRLGVRRRGVRRRAVRRNSGERAQACHTKSFFTTFSRQIPYARDFEKDVAIFMFKFHVYIFDFQARVKK
jgi:hypothetical protein